MRRHHHLLALLRGATSSTRAVSHVAEPLHSLPSRNGATVPISLRFFSSRARSTAGAAKSLIEDEAELSDWISDLKTDKFQLGLSSGDEGEAASSRRPAAPSRGGGRGGRDSRGSFSKSKFGSGDFGGDRRGFERRGRVMSSDMDDDDDDGDSGFGSRRGRHGRGGQSSEFSLRGGRGNGFDDDAGFRSPRGQQGRGGRASGVSWRGGRFSDLDEDAGFGSSRGRRGRGGRISGLSQRRGRGSDLDDDEDDDDDAVGFGSSGRRQVRGQRGGKAEGFGSHRGGRGGDVNSGHRKLRGEKKFDFGDSEEEEEEEEEEAGDFDEDDEPSGFDDDLSGDEVDEVLESKPISFESTEGESAKQKKVEGSRGVGTGDSYLSQKR